MQIFKGNITFLPKQKNIFHDSFINFILAKYKAFFILIHKLKIL